MKCNEFLCPLASSLSSCSIMSAVLIAALVLAANSGCRKKPKAAVELPPKVAASEVKADPFEVFNLKDCTVDLLDVAIGTNGFGVIGGVGVIYVTDDFGANWRLAFGPVVKGPEFGSVLLEGSNRLWCVSRSLLERSVDGGRTWTECSRPKGNFYHYGLADMSGETLLLLQPPTCGVAVYATRNGQDWDSLPGPLPRNDYEIVHFLDGKRGWVGGNYGRFALTTDGGRSWSKHDLPGDSHVVQMQFLDPSNGWIRVAGTGGRLHRTADGGLTWRQVEPVPAPARAVRDMQWFSAERGVALAEVKTGKTHVLRTEDGAKTWTLLGTHDADFTALFFRDQGHGWLVGRRGMVCRYGDLKANPVTP